MTTIEFYKCDATQEAAFCELIKSRDDTLGEILRKSHISNADGMRILKIEKFDNELDRNGVDHSGYRIYTSKYTYPLECHIQNVTFNNECAYTTAIFPPSVIDSEFVSFSVEVKREVPKDELTQELHTHGLSPENMRKVEDRISDPDFYISELIFTVETDAGSIVIKCVDISNDNWIHHETFVGTNTYYHYYSL